jgi:hypothetical protein
VKAKLKTFDEVKNISQKVKKYLGHLVVYHSYSRGSISLVYDDISKFGTIVNVVKADKLEDRILYRDDGQTYYYDEWFEWLGEELPIIEPLSDHLWDISDW